MTIELNDQQRQAAEYNGSAKNILVTAGAGCGKTRTIIGRAIQLIKTGSDASKILMMTFTNRAADAMKTRLKAELGSEASRIQASTFHSFCLRMMRKYPKKFNAEAISIIDEDDQQSLMGIVRKRYISKHEKELNRAFPKSEKLILMYSYSRNTCQDPHQYLQSIAEIDDQFKEIICKIFDEYQNAKNIRGYQDYDDLLEIVASSLTAKPGLRRVIAKQYDEILVDEMQDTNSLQFKILKHFSAEGVRLFCVGDPAQSIYKFRGAEFRHVYEFHDIFGNSTTIPLSKNYRSYQEILDVPNWLLEKSPLDYNSNLVAHRKESGNLPLLIDFNRKFAEASWIAGKVLERRESDMKYRDMMVLVRSGSDAGPIEAEFLRREIPYYFIGGTSITKTAHVRDVLSLLRVARNKNDELAWMRYLRLWPRIGEKTAEKVVNNFYENTHTSVIDILQKCIGSDNKAITAYRATARKVLFSPKLCVNTAIKFLTPLIEEKYDKRESRLQDLKLLSTVSGRYESLDSFIDDFTLEPMTSTQIKKPENNDAVLIITVHSAKGTEAPICFVANASPGVYPHSRSFGVLNDEEEERRVLYVALTRAKNELYITRSNENNSSFNLVHNLTEGEGYFLANVPDELVMKENFVWGQHTPATLPPLRDLY